MAIGKRLKKAREGVDREKLYPIADAIKMVKERAKSKFDETVEIAINLGVDPRHADQMVRGVVTLPNGTGQASCSEEKLVENVKALADAVAKAKPAGAKGTYIQRVAVSSTMGPGVKVEPGSLH